MLLVRRPRSEQLHTLLDRARGQAVTYPDIGATSTDSLPEGYHHDHYERRLGDTRVFERARSGLQHWVPHNASGARIFPDDPVSRGATLLVVLSFGPLHMVAPCRIMEVVDDPDEFGFSYGTLPGHPEEGEESFRVERTSSGTVFRIAAFSTPSDLLVRALAPAARAVQKRTTRRYLDGLARYAFSQ